MEDNIAIKEPIDMVTNIKPIVVVVHANIFNATIA
jgi:hypothetical protein